MQFGVQQRMAYCSSSEDQGYLYARWASEEPTSVGHKTVKRKAMECSFRNGEQHRQMQMTGRTA